MLAQDGTASGLKDVVAIGYRAFYGTGAGTAGPNGTVAIGSSALTALTSGAVNTAIGFESMLATITGANNTALGYQSLKTNVDGSNNVAVGSHSLFTFEASSGGDGCNTAVGANSGYLVSTGQDNVLIGENSGWINSGVSLTTGSGNTLVGYQSAIGAAGGVNRTAIGKGTTAQADDSVTLGNASVTAVYMAQDSGAIVHSGALVNGLTAVNVSTSTLAYDTHQIVRGKYVTVSADAQTITLPAVQIGAVFIIVNIAADGGALLTISPDGNDKFLTNIAGSVGTDNKDITTTKATQNQGDFVKLVGMSADGWAITEISGIWADES
jgi:hypothetical protein